MKNTLHHQKFAFDNLTKMNKINKLQLSLLNDYYGTLLTEYQNGLIRLYYDEDLSLAEIAELNHISRQAALDVINRGTVKLQELEEKLKIVAKNQLLEKEIKNLMLSCDGETHSKLQSILKIVEEL